MNENSDGGVLQLTLDASACGPAQLEPTPPNNETQRRVKRRDSEQFAGVIIGRVTSVGDVGGPLVDFPGNPTPEPVPARATVSLKGDAIGREVPLLFEGGDPFKPIIVGVLQPPQPLNAQVDDERVVITAGQEIVLSCGKASITLTRAGKILIRGAYLLSRSSGVNRIKGGSVQIN